MSNSTVQEGTVTSYEKCPVCTTEGGVVMQTYVTGEQAGCCGTCGYTYVRRVMASKEGKPLLTIDHKFNFTVEENRDPYGAVHIVDKEGNADMYTVATAAQMDTIAAYISGNREAISEAILSRFLHGEVRRSDLLNPPKEEPEGPLEQIKLPLM